LICSVWVGKLSSCVLLLARRKCGTHGVRHGAAREPARERARICRRAFQLHLPRVQHFRPCASAEEDPVERPDIGGYEHINFKARMAETDRDIFRLDDQPVSTLGSAEIELDHYPRPRDVLMTDVAAQPPHEDDRIELVRPRIAEGPARVGLVSNLL
jgi:hypothetical protein